METKPLKIRIKIKDEIITATMNNSSTTRDFLSLLPLNVTLEDYAKTEKIYNLPKKLSTEGVPSGYNPSIGDITYYASWGNLAIFYKDFGYTNGLIFLGRIDGESDAFNTKGSLKVIIESYNEK